MSFSEYCRKEKKRIALTAAVSLLLVPVFLAAGRAADDIYLAEGDRVVGLMPAEETEAAELLVTAERDGVSVTKEVVLRRRRAESEGRYRYEATDDERLRTELNTALKDLSLPEDEELILPSELDDGTVLIWRRREKGKAFLLPLMAGPLMIVYGYRGEKDKEKKTRQEEADSIIRSLPEFNNKVVLLLGSGMVLDDVLALIAEETEDGEKNALSRLLAEAAEEAGSLNGDVMKVLSLRSADKQIRELSRMVNLIYENRYTGADLVDKLSDEAEDLWDRRKKLAVEKGRKAETKLALPMSVTLMALVAVAAAPAMMQI